jgi:hypothetical protein
VTWIAAAELVGLIVFGFLLFQQSGRHIRHLSEAYDAWRQERRELLNRIQTARPVFASEPVEPPEPRAPDELHKVGTVAPLHNGDEAA